VNVRDKSPASGALGAFTLVADVDGFGIGIGSGIDPNRIDMGGEVRRYNAEP